MTRPDPSTIAAVKARYEAERAKRVRDEGLAQYHSLGEYHLDRDPWADPDFHRDPVAEDVDVVVLGGGWAGMLAAIDLSRRGITNYRIIEKAADFGGTWYWNRYPGCMCDVDATIYLPLLEETGYMPTEKYASAAEIFGYCQLLARHFGLYEHALFQTEVESLSWDDDAHRWDLVTQRGDHLRTQFFVSAGGFMHKAKLPGIDGIERFEGKAFHTTRWDYEYTGGSPTEPMDQLADKVVGIIGTGATSVQLVPQLARAAKEVYVFQRTPSAIGVRAQQPIDETWFRSLPPGWQARAHAQLHRGRDRQPSRPRHGRRRVDRGDAGRHPADRRDRRGARRARGDRLRGDGVVPPPDRRDRRGPGDRGEAQALVRQALQAVVLPRRVPAGVQPAERAPRRHRRSGRPRDVARGPGGRRRGVPARPARSSRPGSRSRPGSSTGSASTPSVAAGSGSASAGTTAPTRCTASSPPTSRTSSS